MAPRDSETESEGGAWTGSQVGRTEAAEAPGAGRRQDRDDRQGWRGWQGEEWRGWSGGWDGWGEALQRAAQAGMEAERRRQQGEPSQPWPRDRHR